LCRTEIEITLELPIQIRVITILYGDFEVKNTTSVGESVSDTSEIEFFNMAKNMNPDINSDS